VSYYLYVSLAEDNRIAIFTMDPRTGKLQPKEEVRLHSGPGAMAVDPTKRFAYTGLRSTRELVSFRIDPATGSLQIFGKPVTLDADPCYLATDRKGRFLLSAYYSAGLAAVHPIGPDGAVAGPPVEWRQTAANAHSIQTDPSNRFAFVPHIAGPNLIFQFLFDEQTGRLTPNLVPTAAPFPKEGPRHFCFHPDKDLVYFVNEQANSVTSYRFDRLRGTLTALEAVSTLPDGFQEQSHCADIHITRSGRFMYASNRGHDSIACFAVHPDTGRLESIGQQPTEKSPRAFMLDPECRYLYAAGGGSGRLAAYRIDEQSGALEPLEVYEVGASPSWVLVLELGG
jgi:6-phosphogluconolactonase